jgi:hypothetical protein
MSCHVLTSLWIIPTESLQHFVVIKPSSLVRYFEGRDFAPSPYYLIVIFVVADRHGVMDDIADSVNQPIDFFQEYCFTSFDLLLFELIGIFELYLLLTWVFFVGFLFIANSLTYIIPLHLEAVELVAN